MNALSILTKKRQVSVNGVIGGLIVTANVVAAIFAPLIAPYGEADPVGDVWGEPSWQHLLGLDNLGRDMLTRIIYGARTTIAVALVITLLAFAVGVSLGFAAALRRGWLDTLMSRFVDSLMAVPTLIFSLILLSVLGTSIPVLIGTIALLDSTRIFRLARSVGMNIASLDYVEVAHLRGERIAWIVYREVLPNALLPLAAEFGLRFCFAFLFIASLSFLGLGIQPPEADWGGMVRENAQAISIGGMAPLFPAMAIIQMTIGVNLLVDQFLSFKSPFQEGRA